MTLPKNITDAIDKYARAIAGACANFDDGTPNICRAALEAAIAAAMPWHDDNPTDTDTMRTSIRLGVVLACLCAAGWTCSAMLRPWRVAALTFEQCLELVRQGQASTAVAMELRQHLGKGLAALRLCGPDGAVLLQQLAKELAK